MNTIRKLVNAKYDLFNIDVEKKRPCGTFSNGSTGGIKDWEKKSYEELTKMHDYNYEGFGMRMGLQTNGKYIISMDFDCCGDKDKTTGQRLGCVETKKLCEAYFKLGVEKAGFFNSSTKGNYNLLIDITACPILLDIIQNFGGNKMTLYGLEMLVSNGVQQILPPTKTKCKITGQYNNERKFFDEENPIYILDEYCPLHNFVKSCFEDAQKEKTIIKKNLNNKYMIKHEENNIEENNNFTDEEITNKIKQLKKLIDELPDEYIHNYDYWLNIGFVIYNETNGHKLGYDLYDEISKRSNKYDNNYVYDKYYNGIQKRDGNQKKLTLATLKHWVKQENVYLWDETFTSGLLAEYFIKNYKNKFITVRDVSYFFNGIHWEQDSKNHCELTKFINNFFINDLLRKTYKYKEYLLDLSMTPEERKFSDEKMNRFEQNVKNLKHITNRKKLIDDIINTNNDNSIIFDENIFYFVFKNKIYDLENDKFIVPNPKDYLLNTAGYDYIESSEEDKKTLNDLIDTIFTDKNNRDDYLVSLSTGLCGKQIENLFIATGSGGNGKSLINSLMLKTVGTYGYKLPSCILLSMLKQGSNPELALLNNKRFVLCQEPPSNQRIVSSTIKELTGDKTLNARLNHSNDCNVNLKLSFFLECNDIPLIDEVGDAVVRRLRFNVFSSLFVNKDTYETLDEEQRKSIFLGNPLYKDDKWQDKFKCVLFDILREKFKIFKKNEYILDEQPKINKDKAREYLGASDNVYDWFQGYYEKSDENNEITLTSIYKKFSESKFYENLSKKDKREQNRKKFVDKIEKNIFLKKHIKTNTHTKLRVLVGWKEKEVNDEQEVNEEIVEKSNSVEEEKNNEEYVHIQ